MLALPENLSGKLSFEVAVPVLKGFNQGVRTFSLRACQLLKVL